MCPVPQAYDAATRAKGADELMHLPAESVIARWMVDYFRLRAAAFACLGERP